MEYETWLGADVDSGLALALRHEYRTKQDECYQRCCSQRISRGCIRRHHYLQLPHALERITIDAELEHIQDLEVEESPVMASIRWDGATTQG